MAVQNIVPMPGVMQIPIPGAGTLQVKTTGASNIAVDAAAGTITFTNVAISFA